MASTERSNDPKSPFESSTFHKNVSINVAEDMGAASMSPSGRDVVLADRAGLMIIDLDMPYSPPRHIVNRTSWEVADVQWSPFAERADWIASTCNQKALIYNLSMADSASKAPIEHTLHAHSRTITDINFSAHKPDLLATCAVDSFVMTWDLRTPKKLTHKFQAITQDPILKFADFQAGATQVKWNRQDENMIASSHDRFLRVWDQRFGARPVTTIAAHETKIYGIDWHRSDPTRILTCSLDKTVKLWDKVGKVSDFHHPSRVIRTQYPVWRARHTPFPNGILAMSKRGNASLDLYTYDADESEDSTSVTKPAYSFQAHKLGSSVKEFLWRSRGCVEDDLDYREFQLVSWGSDKHLHLHGIPPSLLSKSVGYHKGAKVAEKPSDTRKGAKYVTYRDPAQQNQQSSRKGIISDQSQQKGNLSSLLQQFNLADAPQSAFVQGGPERTTMTGVRVGRNAPRRVVNQIKWIGGVQVREGHHDLERKAKEVDTPNDQYPRKGARSDLATEIMLVGKQYSRVTFEHVSVENREITVSFNGPWGAEDFSQDRKADNKLAFLRMNMKFPTNYPRISDAHDEDDEYFQQLNPLHVEFEKTTAVIEESTFSRLKEDVQRIADHYSTQNREALGAVICYALGERSLEDSLLVPGGADEVEEVDDVGEMLDLTESLAGESSSDDDADEGTDLDAMHSSVSNANIPLPVQCSVRFSANGSLVVARMPPVAPSLALLNAPIRLSRFHRQGPTKDEIFETFGRFITAEDPGSDSPSSSLVSWNSSSSPSSSGSDDEADAPPGRFQPPLAWQRATVRFQPKASHPSSTGASKVNKSKSLVSILASAVEDLIPSKLCLAEEYWIFGDGPSVCAHNADVARKYGFQDLADIWHLCKLILKNQVPLDILPQQHRREQVLVLARRALVRIKRKDSGLDLQFDEADTVTNPKLRGRIKWGYHSVKSWLIPALFEYYENIADTQMLAMLSCVFSEPAAREGVTNAIAKMRQSNLPMSMEAPAFSLDYFSSAEAAWSLFKPTISIPSTPAHSRYATPVNEFGWHRLTKNLDTYGSHGSSNGPWGSDTLPSEPVTPYSTGNTPPNLSRAPTLRSMTSNTPFSSSPEQSHVAKKSSTANFASAIASLSRPFANVASSSPPIKSRMEADLSTSAPTSGVTWGTTTFYSSGSNERNMNPSRNKHSKRASFGQADRLNVDYYSDSDSEYGDTPPIHDGASEYTAPLTSRQNDKDEASNIRVTLKNQDRFDDEACVSAPLLDVGKEWLYRAWREQYAEMLGCWGLTSRRAEVLKFNGLISYFPPSQSRGGSKAGSMHLALRSEAGENTSGRIGASLSRTSTLAPPPFGQFRRSPNSSPRHFSFNPEATEFLPGMSFEPDILAPPLDVFISSEQCLRLSILAQPRDEDEGVGDMGLDGTAESKLKARPTLSRTHSNISGKSSLPGPSKRDVKKDPIYTCSICWIRVCGRFYLCPSCGHVAHFSCMEGDADEDLRLAWEEGECVVGCACGCGFEVEDEKEVTTEPKTRLGWDERGGWMPEDHGHEEELGVPHGHDGIDGDTWKASERQPLAWKKVAQRSNYRRG